MFNNTIVLPQPNASNVATDLAVSLIDTSSSSSTRVLFTNDAHATRYEFTVKNNTSKTNAPLSTRGVRVGIDIVRTDPVLLKEVRQSVAVNFTYPSAANFVASDIAGALVSLVEFLTNPGYATGYSSYATIGETGSLVVVNRLLAGEL